MTATERFLLFPQLLNISTGSLQQLEQHSKVQFFEAGSTLIKKGDKVGGIYLVTSGCLRVYTTNVDGNESTLYDVNAGESCLLAMNSIFSLLRYPAWVSCSSPLTKTIFVPSNVYRALYDAEPAVRSFTMEVLSQRIFNIMSLLDQALSLSLEQRLVSYLLRKSDQDNYVIANHQTIASELGTAREVISRHLKALEKSGYISLTRGVIQILALEALRKLLPQTAIC